MKITITGPRSVGKSTISKRVADEMGLKYISSDEIGEEAFKEYGGLDKAIKSGKVEEIINNGGHGLILNVYDNEKDFVFDLSGGAFSSEKMAEASQKVRESAKRNSIIIGLLPFEDVEKSISFLFEREKERVHFKEMDKDELLAKVRRNYLRFPSIFEKFCDLVVYVGNKKSEEITREIVDFLEERVK